MDRKSLSPFTRRVKDVIRRIPRGCVATYGQVAALAGNHRAARGVAWVLRTSTDADRLPWHRVIGASGRISLPRGRGFEEQARKLRAEGVTVSRAGRIDLGRYMWDAEGRRPSRRPGAARAGGVPAPTAAARAFLRALTRERPRKK